MSEKTGLARLIDPMRSLFRPNGVKQGMTHSNGSSAFTSLFGMVLPSTFLPQTSHDYAGEVGDGLGSSVLAGPLNFLMRTFPEAPGIVQRLRKQEWAEDAEHPLPALFRNPNPYYSGRVLWMATILDFAFGNAFLYKIRNGAGQVIQLWWLPRGTVQPKWPNDGSVFVSHYEYNVNGEVKKLAVDDVVHLRFGLDPRNPRLGLSPLGSLMREVGIDDTAANFNASVLRNLGIIGLIIAPKEKGVAANKDAVKETKEYLKQNFTGDKRGEPLALGAPTDVTLLQYQMQNFDTSPIRDVSEERVCAALGLPAAVVGFGTGLQQTKVGATMKEMRQLAWTGGIIPMQEVIAEEVNRALLPEFEVNRRQSARFIFDTTKVRALWEDNNEKHTRVREDYKAGIIDRATALRETGRPAEPADEGVYFTAQQQKPDGNQPTPEEQEDDTAERD